MLTKILAIIAVIIYTQTGNGLDCQKGDLPAYYADELSPYDATWNTVAHGSDG